MLTFSSLLFPPELNASAPEGTSYKVIYFARHGQGYHNVAEVKYSAEGKFQEKTRGEGKGRAKHRREVEIGVGDVPLANLPSYF